MPRYYALSDIVVMPSLCDESAGKVAMEGMASGRAVITTTAGGIPEYVTKECGILLDRGDGFVSDLRAAILDLAQNAAKRRRMGTAGALESRRFAPAIYYANYVKLVSDEVDSPRRTSHDAADMALRDREHPRA
jgi:glycosyltransferase involved in cell wall biosynthesis